MSDTTAAVDREFAASGWEALPAPAELTRLFRCHYAVAGIVVANSAAEAVVKWPPAQDAMATCRTKLGIQRGVDMFLVFILPEIGEDALPIVSGLTSDTHVCRKLAIEIGGRPAGDALQDLPFLAPRRADSGAEDSPVVATAALPSEVLDDLGRRGAETILEKLLDSRYERARAKR